MSRQALNLRDAMKSQIEDVDVVCSRCGGPLGRYQVGPGIRGLWLIDSDRRVQREEGLPTPRRFGRRGPKTQPALYMETFGGRQYLRKKCPCGANEKRREDHIGALSITIRDDDVAVLVF